MFTEKNIYIKISQNLISKTIGYSVVVCSENEDVCKVEVCESKMKEEYEMGQDNKIISGQLLFVEEEYKSRKEGCKELGKLDECNPSEETSRKDCDMEIESKVEKKPKISFEDKIFCRSCLHLCTKKRQWLWLDQTQMFYKQINRLTYTF